MSKFLKTITKRVRKESKPLIMAALRSGANNVGIQLADVARDVNQPSDIFLGKLVTALKSGVLAAGQEIVSGGLDRVKGVNPPDHTSKFPE